MNCLECQDLLQRRLDGENIAHALMLDRHLAGCQSCRETYAAGSLMLDGLKALGPTPQPRAEFTTRLVGKILRDRERRKARARQRLWVTVSLAAAILVMVVAGNLWTRRQPDAPPVANNQAPAQDAGPRAATLSGAHDVPKPPRPDDSPAPKTLEEKEKVVPLAESVAEARSSFVSLISRSADQVRDQTRPFVSLPPMEIPTFPEDGRLPMQEPLDPAAQSILQAGQGVSEGLQPVSRNARRAVSYFMKELPVFDAAN